MDKIHPLKHLGQNFLIDKSVIKKVIRSADLKPRDIILEIGPGLGALTQELAKKVKKVIAVEKDPRICQVLKENLKEFKNVEVVQGDILKLGIGLANPHWDWLSQSPKKYKIIANLPFYITAPVIRKFLESENPPKEMVLMVQKEVAQRICALPAKVFAKQKFRRARPPKMNILAVSVQFYADSKIISYVSKKSFYPQPKVDAAIIKIIPRTNCATLGVAQNNFFRVVKAGFSQPRKQVINNLSKGLKINKQKIVTLLAKINIKPTQRAETLSIDNWLDLSKVL